MQKSYKQLVILAVLVFLSACHTQPNKSTLNNPETWLLSTDSSSLSFVSTKNKTITEQHSLQFKHGQIDHQGSITATMDLNTVDTAIPIRDQRMRDILFETETFPLATVSASLPENINLKLQQNIKLPFQLDLHGQQKTYTTEVVIQMVNEKLVAVNYEPILVNAKDFGLDSGINQLTKIAGLQSIDYAVSVDFKLTFEKD